MDTDTLPRSLMVIEPDNLNALDILTNENGMADIDTITINLSPLQKANYIRDLIRNMLNLQTSVSQAIMGLLWRVHSNSLWQAACDENGLQRYIDFRQWVREELPGYDEERSDLWDCVRICESVLPFALQNVIQTKDGITVTPTYLIEEVGIAKLKTRRGNFEDENLTREQKVQIMSDMTRLSVRKLNALYSKSRHSNKVVTGFLNTNPEGTADLILPGLSVTQVEFIRAALGNKLDEQLVHLDSQERKLLRRLRGEEDCGGEISVEIETLSA